MMRQALAGSLLALAETHRAPRTLRLHRRGQPEIELPWNRLTQYRSVVGPIAFSPDKRTLSESDQRTGDRLVSVPSSAWRPRGSLDSFVGGV
jgi:hypothetical protein